MYATYEDFKRAVEPSFRRYWDDNAWVQSWTKWEDEEQMDRYCNAAYALYNAARNNQLNYTLLGGTGIRMCRHLISNFGVTGASGIQEKETQRLVNAEEKARAEKRRGFFQPNDAAHHRAPPVLGGAILSEKMWTPLLNDALIIGAITAHKTFSLTLETSEHHLFRQCGELVLADEIAKVKQTLPHITSDADAARLAKGTVDLHRRQWKEFMNRNSGMLWEIGQIKGGGGSYQRPRVLSRELLGLSFFGYQPVFGQGSLHFKPPLDHTPDPTFQTYVNRLNALDFQNANKTTRKKVMSAISKFLFGDPKAVQMQQDRSFYERQYYDRVPMPA